MTKKLTEGQKRARSVIKASVREMLRELDTWRSNEAYIDFTTYFHMDCIRRDLCPGGQSWPIYVTKGNVVTQRVATAALGESQADPQRRSR